VRIAAGIGSIATIAFAAAVAFIFQHIGWHNTAVLQQANEIVERASKAYEESAEILAKRRYASFRYIYALEKSFEKKPSIEVTSSSSGFDVEEERIKYYHTQIREW
jgi:hypothetical protein